MSFANISMKPRRWARMIKGQGGSWPNPDKKLVAPVKFGQERAQELVEAARAAAKYGPWSDRLQDQMTDGEIVYVLAVWDTLSGSSSFMSAFGQIWHGNIEAFEKAYAEVEA